MVYRIELLCTMMRFLADLLHAFKKYLSMALCSNSSSHASSHQPPPWKKLPEPPAATAVAVAVTVAAGGSNGHTTDQNNSHSVEELVGSRLAPKERSNENTATAGSNGHTTNHNNWHSAEELVATRLAPKEHLNEKNVQEAPQQSASSTTMLAAPPPMKAPENKPQKERMRPSMITIPVPAFSNGRFGFPDHVEMERNGADQKDYVTVLEADGYCLASRRGRRRHAAMEDGHDIISCIDGDSKQAYFGVFDGHGGRAAVDFVSGKLGKNILAALHELEKEESQSQPEMAIRKGYLITDREFLSQGVRSGVCAATVLLKDGNLHVANVGDCRVVMSRKGVAYALTDDHRPGREDEQNRIVNSGGFVSCHNGMWRVQDSLAVSRAFGNESMKEWIICEPETRKIHLTPDCEFLVMASDGLWDKVTNQEAVDVVMKHKTSIDSCKELVEISCNRGNRDDITVMVIKLETFVQLELENVQKVR